MVQCQQLVAVRQDKLIEGVADIPIPSIHHSGLLIGDLHFGDAHAENQIRLMMLAVYAFVHFMAGMHIEHVLILRHAQTACSKGNIGVRAVKGGLPHAKPVFGVTNDAYDLCVVVLLRIILPEDEEEIIRALIEAAEQRQLHRQRLPGEKLLLRVIALHGDVRACRLHSCRGAVVVVDQIGFDRRSPYGITLPADIVRDSRRLLR